MIKFILSYLQWLTLGTFFEILLGGFIAIILLVLPISSLTDEKEEASLFIHCFIAGLIILGFIFASSKIFFILASALLTVLALGAFKKSTLCKAASVYAMTGAVQMFLTIGNYTKTDWPILIPVLGLAAYIAVLFLLLTGKVLKVNVVQPNKTGPTRPYFSTNNAQQITSNKTDSLPTISASKLTKINFSALADMQETKDKLLSIANEILSTVTTPELARNGILLSGEPGNGKTLFAEALAGELKLPFKKITFDDVASKWVNQTTEAVKQAFAEAKAAAPCVFFIDEIDSFLVSREKISNADSETSRMTNAMLTLINDLRAYKVILLAATNHPDRLDSAGNREGRFDFKLTIPPPDYEARMAILSKAIQVAIDKQEIQRAAKRWEGFSAARIAAIGKELSVYAKDKKLARVNFDDLMQALRRVQGSAGDRLPEDTPNLLGIFLPVESEKKLKSIALRMREIEKIEELGGTVPAGLLFYGPPGTGKTLTVRALAKETGWAYIATNGQSLMRESNAIANLLKRATSLRPVIVFIDEADDVLANRVSQPWNKTIVNELLTAIDGGNGKASDIVWIAATNLPNSIDSSMLRGGRFTEKILFDLPDQETATRYIANWLSKSKAKFEQNLLPEILAASIGRVSIANINAVLQAAVNNWIGSDEPAVTTAHVREACATILTTSPIRF